MYESGCDRRYTEGRQCDESVRRKTLRRHNAGNDGVYRWGFVGMRTPVMQQWYGVGLF
jgi:hypothetical protein